MTLYLTSWSTVRENSERSWVSVLLGPFQIVETLSVSPEDGYVLYSIRLVTEDDSIPALLAVPSGPGPFPAVVVFHQHAGQRHVGKSEVFGLVGDPYQAFGPELARAGFVVLAPDSIAFEDRRPAGVGTDPRDDDWDQHYNAMASRLVAGDTLMRKVLVDAMAAVSVLVARDDVRQDAVTALGHSYGGNTTLFLAALDERVRAGCASGALGSYRHKIRQGTGIEMAEVIPGFAARFDMHHVMAAIAPRPFLVVSGTDDQYAADAQLVVDEALAIVQALGGAQAFSHLQVSGVQCTEAHGRKHRRLVRSVQQLGTRQRRRPRPASRSPSARV